MSIASEVKTKTMHYHHSLQHVADLPGRQRSRPASSTDLAVSGVAIDSKGLGETRGMEDGSPPAGSRAELR